MDISIPQPLLGALSPHTFMRRHWQKKPLCVRQAFAPADLEWIDRPGVFALASKEGVESRLVTRDSSRWTLQSGPLTRRMLPRIDQSAWTVLVQGVDLHVEAARELLSRFRFVPDARLDDLMVSWASDGGGVGPHVDSYDVFLLQLKGHRRWRVGPPGDASLDPDAPLRLLRHFEPTQEWLLEAGDMLYLPPKWAHDGVAQGECLTASIGFRAPAGKALGREVLQCMLDGAEPPENDPLYSDRSQPATASPARIPAGLHEFARQAAERFLNEPRSLACALGEVLTEPKPTVWFEPAPAPAVTSGIRLDRRSRMLYDEHHVFLNGESFRAGGRDARLMRHLADQRQLSVREIASLGSEARELLNQWLDAGWLQPLEDSKASASGKARRK